MLEVFERAYSEGRKARIANVPRSVCPYVDAEVTKQTGWLRGWTDARPAPERIITTAERTCPKCHGLLTARLMCDRCQGGGKAYAVFADDLDADTFEPPSDNDRLAALIAVCERVVGYANRGAISNTLGAHTTCEQVARRLSEALKDAKL